MRLLWPHEPNTGDLRHHLSGVSWQHLVDINAYRVCPIYLSLHQVFQASRSSWPKILAFQQASILTVTGTRISLNQTGWISYGLRLKVFFSSWIKSAELFYAQLSHVFSSPCAWRAGKYKRQQDAADIKHLCFFFALRFGPRSTFKEFGIFHLLLICLWWFWTLKPSACCCFHLLLMMGPDWPWSCFWCDLAIFISFHDPKKAISSSLSHKFVPGDQG